MKLRDLKILLVYVWDLCIHKPLFLYLQLLAERTNFILYKANNRVFTVNHMNYHIAVAFICSWVSLYDVNQNVTRIMLVRLVAYRYLFPFSSPFFLHLLITCVNLLLVGWNGLEQSGEKSFFSLFYSLVISQWKHFNSFLNLFFKNRFCTMSSESIFLCQDDYWWQAHLSKTISLNFGLWCTFVCLQFLGRWTNSFLLSRMLYILHQVFYCSMIRL